MPSHLNKFVLGNASRVLSWIDRRPNSVTFGCADRNFWHYKIVDFPCAMLQETSLTLALLYSVKFEGNIYYQNEYIKKIALAQVNYWKKIQNRNGSFDEFYPNEQSFSATAFTLYSSIYTLQIFKHDPSTFKITAKKACEYLLNYGNPGASNQIAAAMAAITVYAELFSDSSYDSRIKERLNQLLDSQSSEGWTPEYGGFDVGYQSITISYLSDYCSRRPSDYLSNKLLDMIKFIAHFIHPDLTVGGEYGSRDTSFMAPYGFAYNMNKSKTASSVIYHLFICTDSKINTYLDDRYICHFILPSYLLTIKSLEDIEVDKYPLPYENIFSMVNEESGLWVESRPDYYFICNTKKQGIFKIYRKGSHSVLSNLGYLINNDKRLAVTNWINENANIIFKQSKVQINGVFFLVSNKQPNPIYHFALRIVAVIFRKKLLPILKKYFILRDKPLKGFFNRSIIVSDSSIIVHDIITQVSIKKGQLYKNETSSFRYVAPSNYFQTNELSFSNSPIMMDTEKKHIQITQKINCKNFVVENQYNNITNL